MSKVKAIICSVLLSIVIFAFYFLMEFIKIPQELSLFYFITCAITGIWTAEKIIDFYDWLRKK